MDAADLVLTKHNIYPGVKAYDYIRYMITANTESLSSLKLKTVYDEVATYFNVSVVWVQRSIIRAIETSNLRSTPKTALATLQREYLSLSKKVK